MARVFIDDRWLKNGDDGTSPTAQAKRSLAMAPDPFKAQVLPKWRTPTYGKGKRWRVRWYMTDMNGVKVQKTKAFAKRSDAEEFQAAIEDDVRRGRYMDPSDAERSFRQAAEEWLATKIDIRESTLSRYRRELRVYVYPQWGNSSLRELNVHSLQEWVRQLKEGTYKADLAGSRNPKPLSPRTIRSIVRIVTGGILEYAAANGWISTNPVDHLVLPKPVKANDDMVFLTIPEVEAIASSAAAVGRDVDGIIVQFQAYVGTRINECFALQVRDLNLEKKTARIRRTWTRTLEGTMRLGAPKNGEARTVALPGFLIEPLRELVAGKRPEDFVFRTVRGGHIDDGNWRYRVWNKALRHAGMEDEGITIHTLRHTYASIAIAAGADVKTLQKQLGHATAAMTLDTYAALWPDRLDDVANVVSNMREKALDHTLEPLTGSGCNVVAAPKLHSQQHASHKPPTPVTSVTPLQSTVKTQQRERLAPTRRP